MMRSEYSAGQIRGLPFQDDTWRRITQRFGVRNPIYKSGVHDGLDVACVEGTPLANPFAEGGQIIRAGLDGSSGGFGNYVVIKGDRGGTVLFAHLKYPTPWYRSLLYRLPGTGRVAYGQFVGVTGNTGHSTGPHLHIQCSLGSRYADLFRAPVDPLPFLALRT